MGYFPCGGSGCCNNYNDNYNCGSNNDHARDAVASRHNDVNCRRREVYYEKDDCYSSRDDACCADRERDCCNNFNNSCRGGSGSCYGPSYGGCGYGGGCGFGGGCGYGGDGCSPCGGGFGRKYYGKGPYGGYRKGCGGPATKLCKGLGYNAGKRFGKWDD